MYIVADLGTSGEALDICCTVYPVLTCTVTQPVGLAAGALTELTECDQDVALDWTWLTLFEECNTNSGLLCVVKLAASATGW
jgi:hypothetical protein